MRGTVRRCARIPEESGKLGAPEKISFSAGFAMTDPVSAKIDGRPAK